MMGLQPENCSRFHIADNRDTLEYIRDSWLKLANCQITARPGKSRSEGWTKQAEEIYGKPCRQVVLEMLNRGRSCQVIADLLGVSEATIRRYKKEQRIRQRWE